MADIQIIQIKRYKLKANLPILLEAEPALTLDTKELFIGGEGGIANIQLGKQGIQGIQGPIGITGAQGIQGIKGDASTQYAHTQISPSALWIIDHMLNKFPSIAIVDSAGSVVIGDITYVNANKIEVRFCSAFSGKAYLN